MSIPKSIVVPECPEHGVGGGVKFCWCNQPMAERRYVPAEPTDEMVERAAVRLAFDFAEDIDLAINPADHWLGLRENVRDYYRSAARGVLTAAFSTSRVGGEDT